MQSHRIVADNFLVVDSFLFAGSFPVADNCPAVDNYLVAGNCLAVDCSPAVDNYLVAESFPAVADSFLFVDSHHHYFVFDYSIVEVAILPMKKFVKLNLLCIV